MWGRTRVIAAVVGFTVACGGTQVSRPSVRVEADELLIIETLSPDVPIAIQFAVDSDEILRTSFRALDVVAEAMTNNPGLGLIEVQGHTDSSGKEAYNKKLSRRRAVAVVRYLTSQGVDPSRLRARGYGEKHPAETATGKVSSEGNRRVEFVIIKHNGE